MEEEPAVPLARVSPSPSVSPPRASFSSTVAARTSLSPPTSAPSPVPRDSADIEEFPTEKRVSYYVQALDEMLAAVLDHEAFLFNEAEQGALIHLRQFEYEARYLFVRLYLRKPQWIRLENISYRYDINDIIATSQTLFQRLPFRSEATPPETKPVKIEPKQEELDPNVIDLTADDDEEEDDVTQDLMNIRDHVLDLTSVCFDKETLKLENPEIILSLLSMEELVSLGKRMKVNPGKGTRPEWTAALLRTSNQATLTFQPAASKKPKLENSDSKPWAAFGMAHDAQGNKLNAASVVSKHALKCIGNVIQLSPSYRLLFDRVCLVYHRTSYTASTKTTTSFTASLLARFGKRHYPAYKVSRTFSIFPSRDILKQYECALNVERRIEEILGEVGWEKASVRLPKTAEEKKAEKEKMLADGVSLYNSIEPTWKFLVRGAEKEMKLEDDDQQLRLLYYKRRFHPGWPLARVVYKCATIFAKLGDHDREVSLLRGLLKQTSFRRGKRGDWYDRLALVLMRYPLGEELFANCGPKKKARLAKLRKQEALKICWDGLNDPYTHLIYKSSLQRRINRIESQLEIPKEERTIFKALLQKAEHRIMEGQRLDERILGKKSIWSATNGAEVSVEELALEQYNRDGWKGFHSENGILTTIFTLCFWDIIYAPIDGVFETRFQSAPLDLSTDAFAIVRRPLILKRLQEIERGEAKFYLEKNDDRERALGTFAVGVNWERFSKQDLLEVIECIGGPALATIAVHFAEEWGHRTGGIPDLCLWNPVEKKCMFSEVKSTNDRLSETQRVWLDVLLRAGVGVELCKVFTSAEKAEMDEKASLKRRGSGESGGKGKRAKTEDASDDEPDY